MKHVPDSEPYAGLASLLPPESVCGHLWVALYDAYGLSGIFQHNSRNEDVVTAGVFTLMEDAERSRAVLLRLAESCHARDAALCACGHNRELHDASGDCQMAAVAGLEHLSCGCTGYQPQSLHQSS